MVIALSNYGFLMTKPTEEKKIVLKKTASLCPKCNAILPAEIFEKGGKVYITRTCKKHGRTEELYFGDSEMYKRFEGWAHDGKGIANPEIKKKAPVCPKDCGLCDIHKSHTALGNIVVTNRCDLQCFYCFFYAKAMGYVYEPTQDQIRAMLKKMAAQKPVATNAVQLSVDHDEKILIKDSDGIMKNVKIGDFVNELMSKNETKKMETPISHEKLDVNGFEVLSIDENLHSVFKSIKSVIRHENDEDLFEIETNCGWKIKTTGSHSIFVLNSDGSLVPKVVEDLDEGDILIGSLSSPNSDIIEEIDLLDLIMKKVPELHDKIMVCGFSKEDLKKTEKKIGRNINWDAISVAEYSETGGIGAENIRYFNSKKEKNLPIKLKITPELCRLLGYYAGEGCIYKNGVVFSFGLKEKELVEDFLYCMKSVLGSTSFRKRIMHDSAMQIYIEGYLYKVLFDLLSSGRFSREKRIPWIIFNISGDLKKEFLTAYFRCDGHVRKRERGFEIDHNTVSREMASDLISIHNQLGIVCKIEESVSKSHVVKKTGQYIKTCSKKFRIVIGGKKNLSNALWYLKKNDKTEFEKYIGLEETHAPTYMRFPVLPSISGLDSIEKIAPRIKYLLRRSKYDKSIHKETLEEITDFLKENDIDFNRNLNHISHGDFGVFRVRKIRKVKPTSRYVYDISVSTAEAFFAGLGQLLAHNTGGEPCLREDIIDIIKIAKEEGYDHIQLNTNGIRLANEEGFAQKIRKAGVSTIYLSFDGVTSRTNPKNHWEIPGIIRNCRKAGVGIVLVPTVINGVNDHEIGDILEFGMRNVDVVRGINYQPVSLVGRISNAERKKYRITIPDVIERMERQTDGAVTKNDFYPVPTVSALTHFIEAVSKKPKYELTSHFACGAATYLFIEDGGRIVPLPRFVDIKGLMKYLDDRATDIRKGKSKTWTMLKTARAVGGFIDKKKQPKGLNLTGMMFNILVKRDYGALGALHEKSLFVGMMHFMDKFNFDIERVKRCCIHYAVPDGRILPFCTFNVIPEWYRDNIQRKFSLSIKQWEGKNKRRLSDDFYRRDPEKTKQIPDSLLEMEI
jgi:hypothetical protein